MARQDTYTKSIKDPSSHPYPLSKHEVARLYYGEKLPLREVAARAGTSRQRLARWMEFWGFERRTGLEGRTLFTDKRRAARGATWHDHGWKNKATNRWMAYVPDHPRRNAKGEVPVHVLVAEARIGRYLEDGEVVHHLDKDRDNNAPENLCVMLNREHLTLHWLLGKVGIALLREGRSDEVVRLLEDEPEREFVEAVYVRRLPCVSGLLSNADAAKEREESK
ncbi:MAG: HNH endonuclease [Actinomycetota bacterium]|nr:HNH endonuclease [Actinomycetota bacterium]